ncbi:MAG TPA: hypothetical protein VJ486_10800 [Geothrix sp.]|nr:hypothetical protein [Geothrix sp.]
MADFPFDPNRDHRVSRDEAANLIQAFQVQASAGSLLATAFNRSAFDQLLGQPDAAGIRIYHAQHPDGSPTMVMVAVDATGEDLPGVDAVFAQNGTNCPPFCCLQPWV